MYQHFQLICDELNTKEFHVNIGTTEKGDLKLVYKNKSIDIYLGSKKQEVSNEFKDKLAKIAFN